MLTCFECGAPADHQHHVVPRSKGGTKTVPLCAACHGKVHGHSLGGRNLTKAALGAKKAKGERIGAVPYGYRLTEDGVHLEALPGAKELFSEVRRMYEAGLSLRGISLVLESYGFLSRTGKPFLAEQVRRMLSSVPDNLEARQ